MIFERGNRSEKIIDAFAPKLGDLLSRRIVRRCTHKSEKPLVEGETERKGEREREQWERGEGRKEAAAGAREEKARRGTKNERREARGR